MVVIPQGGRESHFLQTRFWVKGWCFLLKVSSSQQVTISGKANSVIKKRIRNLTTHAMVQHEGLTPAQDKALSLLPIPSAILSIFGSSVILYMAISTRRERKWTTYTRLLIGLSVCDIISSVSLALASFLRRPESGRIWAIGNDATCAIIGTLTQFSYSNIFFNAMLSYYFMITVRFQMKQSRIARYLEPWMHLVSI